MNLFKHLLSGGALAVVMFSASATAQPPSPQACNSLPIPNGLAYLIAPIKSESDLQKHLAGLKTNDSPLNHLSPASLARFTESLSFNESGLTSYRHDVLELDLSVSQAYRVLALFGQQHNITLLNNLRIETELDQEVMQYLKAHDKCNDYKGYKCVSPLELPVSRGLYLHAHVLNPH